VTGDARKNPRNLGKQGVPLRPVEKLGGIKVGKW